MDRRRYEGGNVAAQAVLGREPQAVKILDMSAGARAVWFDKSHPDTVFVDCRPEVKPDIVCDTRELPAEVGQDFDLIVFDPPHKNFGAGSNMAKNYGHHTSAEIRDIIRRSAAEAHRVSKPDALMAFKWSTGDFKLQTALDLMAEHWQPLFGHGVCHQQRRGNATSWVMLRRLDVAPAVSFQLAS